MMAALARKPDASPASKAKAKTSPGNLRIGAPDDAFEREADRVAGEVMSGGRNTPQWSFSRTSITPPLQRKCACGGSGGPEGECEDCKQKKTLQRKAASPAAVSAPVQDSDTHAPAIVDDVLRSPGQPLDHATRGFFESRFGHDFSRVRIHADARAGASARAVNSLAYTVGSDLVFAPGHYAPGTTRGDSLLAHELTHVIQQTGNRPGVNGHFRMASGHDEAKPRRSTAAGGTTSRDGAKPRIGRAELGVQRLMCDSILNAEEATRVSGNDAERKIRTDAVLQLGPKSTQFAIPGASATAFRTECGGSESSIKPQILGGRAGTGTPDIMAIDGKRVELAEVKIGTWQCLDLAEKQVQNYVEKGNSPENSRWRKSVGVNRFELMPTSRFSPSDFDNVSVGWCGPGVIVYKPISKTNEDTFLCSGISDQGALDKFLDKVMDKAQSEVDQFIDQKISQIIDKLVEEKLKEKEFLVLSLARPLIARIKARIIAMLRKEMKQLLRKYLQGALMALCAAAGAKAAVKMKDLLEKLRKEMGLILIPAVAAVAQQIAKEAAEMLLQAAGEMAGKIFDFVKENIVAFVLAVVTAIVIAFCLAEAGGMCVEGEGKPTRMPFPGGLPAPVASGEEMPPGTAKGTPPPGAAA